MLRRAAVAHISNSFNFSEGSNTSLILAEYGGASYWGKR